MKKHSTCTTFRDVICAALAFLMVMALPTGWLYDLWAGTGTERGRRPDSGVERLQRREDVEPAFLAKTPATVSGGELAACPLARLRDVKQGGIHHHHNGGAKKSVYISEYTDSDYPTPIWLRLVFMAGIIALALVLVVRA